MKKESPLPTEPPFLTFYTPTFQRPHGLAKCMTSIERQTAARFVEQVIVPDFVRYGIANGLYGRIPWYAPALRGQYVHILADDDVLYDEYVVEKVIAFAKKKDHPPIIMVDVIKNGYEYPCCDPFGEPEHSCVDVGNFIIRRDIFIKHCADYGKRYEGDFDHAVVLHREGYRREYLNMTFVEGGASNGRPEA